MFAMLGLGVPEIIILGLVGLVVIGGPILVVVLALSMSRKSRGAHEFSEVAELREEVQRLREEVERLKTMVTGTSSSITASRPPRAE